MTLSELLDAMLRLSKATPASSGGPLLEIGLSLDAIMARLLESCAARGALDPEPFRICPACGSKYPMDQSCGCFDNGSQ
jgi:hypothetical protein